MLLNVLSWLAYLNWLGAWFWGLSYGFSASLFMYHLDTRLPVLALALLTVAVPPLVGHWGIHRVATGRFGPVRGRRSTWSSTVCRCWYGSGHGRRGEVEDRTIRSCRRE